MSVGLRKGRFRREESQVDPLRRAALFEKVWRHRVIGNREPHSEVVGNSLVEGSPVEWVEGVFAIA